MLDGVEAHVLLFGETDMQLISAGTPQQYVCLYSFSMRRSHRSTVPHTPSLRCLPSLQTTSNNMCTSEEAGYSGQAEVFHAPQPGCPRDRERSLEIPRLETGGTTGGAFR